MKIFSFQPLVCMASLPAQPKSVAQERLRVNLQLLRDFVTLPLGRGAFSTYLHPATKLKVNSRAALHSNLQMISSKAGSETIKAATKMILARLREMTAIDQQIQAIAKGELKGRILFELAQAHLDKKDLFPAELPGPDLPTDPASAPAVRLRAYHYDQLVKLPAFSARALDKLIDERTSARMPLDERFQAMEGKMIGILGEIERPLNDLIEQLETLLK